MKRLVIMLTALLAVAIAFGPVSAGTVNVSMTYTTQTVNEAVASWTVTLNAVSPAAPAVTHTFTSAPASDVFNNVAPGTYNVTVTAKGADGVTQGAPFTSSNVVVPQPTGSVPTAVSVTASP